MFEWLALRSLFGLPRWVFVLFAVALIALGIVQGMARTAENITQSQTAQREAGASQQRARDLETTVERTEQGNAARAEINDPHGSARYDQCLRSARTPANCQRFMPE